MGVMQWGHGVRVRGEYGCAEGRRAPAGPHGGAGQPLTGVYLFWHIDVALNSAWSWCTWIENVLDFEVGITLGVNCACRSGAKLNCPSVISQDQVRALKLIYVSIMIA